MSEKRNLLNLTDTISSETQLDSRIVKKFISQLFKEIEKGLIVSSSVKIEGLGLFRIIKSISSDKILFLANFKDSQNKPKFDSGLSLDDSLPKTDGDNSLSDVELPLSDSTSASFQNDDSDVLSIDMSVGIHNDSFDKFLEDVAIEDELSSIENKEEHSDGINAETYLASQSENYEKNKNFAAKAKRFFLIFLAVLIIGGVIYALYPESSKKTETSNAGGLLVEVENTDTLNFMHIVRIERNTDFTRLSKIYYGYEIFWPYLFKANEQDIESPFNVQVGTLVKVPRVDSQLIDMNNQESVNLAMQLGKEILDERNGSRSSMVYPEIE